jgi:hypothetical protein
MIKEQENPVERGKARNVIQEDQDHHHIEEKVIGT